MFREQQALTLCSDEGTTPQTSASEFFDDGSLTLVNNLFDIKSFFFIIIFFILVFHSFSHEYVEIDDDKKTYHGEY